MRFGLVSILFKIIFIVFISSGFLILLVFRHKIIHVGLSFSELHLIHALPCVPVKKSFPPEHGGELLRNSLEYFLDGRGVSYKGGSHLETSWWDVATLVITLLGIHSTKYEEFLF